MLWLRVDVVAASKLLMMQNKRMCFPFAFNLCSLHSFATLSSHQHSTNLWFTSTLTTHHGYLPISPLASSQPPQPRPPRPGSHSRQHPGYLLHHQATLPELDIDHHHYCHHHHHQTTDPKGSPAATPCCHPRDKTTTRPGVTTPRRAAQSSSSGTADGNAADPNPHPDITSRLAQLLRSCRDVPLQEGFARELGRRKKGELLRQVLLLAGVGLGRQRQRFRGGGGGGEFWEGGDV